MKNQLLGFSKSFGLDLWKNIVLTCLVEEVFNKSRCVNSVFFFFFFSINLEFLN